MSTIVADIGSLDRAQRQGQPEAGRAGTGAGGMSAAQGAADPLAFAPAPALWRRFCHASPRYRRLRGDVAVFAARLERREAELTERGPAPAWLGNASRLTRAARAALDACAIDEGWKLLHAARREELSGMTAEELDAHALTLAEEAADVKKFPETGWRGRAIVEATRQARAASEPARKAEALAVAARTRDEQSETVYYNYSLVRYQLVILSATLLALLVIGLILIAQNAAEIRAFVAGLTAGTVPRAHEIPLSYAGVALFGAIGATVSAIMSFGTAAPDARIPERQANALVTFARPFVGAVSALIVVYAFQSGLIAPPEVVWVPFAWLLAFAAGFSERLVMRAVDATNGPGAKG